MHVKIIKSAILSGVIPFYSKSVSTLFGTETVCLKIDHNNAVRLI